jgi:hypothetical protein
MTDDRATAAQALLADAFDRIRDLVRPVNDDPPAVLAFRPGPHANTIAWLVWHLTRVQDSHIAHLAGTAEVWHAAGWVERFELDLDPDDTGYGAGPAGVAALDRVSGDLLIGYHADVHAATIAYLATVDDAELARVVDRSWDPPVTASVRLVSVLGDCLQHLGQAAYLRGLAADH